MKVLVIGANGFLGRHICQKFIDNSWEVEGAYHKKKDNIPKKVKVYPINKLENVPEDYDAVLLTVGNFTSSISELFETNVLLTQKIVKKFNRSRIVFISSTAIYGQHKDRISIYSSFNQPNDYGLSKLAGEFIARTHKNASIIRFTALYGPGMNSNLFLPKIIELARKEKVIRIFGDGRRRQNYLYVRDAATLCFLVAEHRKIGIFLGVYGNSFSNNQIAKIVTSYFPGTGIIYNGKDESPSFVFDVTNTKKELGFFPTYSPQEGIGEMNKFYE